MGYIGDTGFIGDIRFMIGTILRKPGCLQDFYIVKSLHPCLRSGVCEFESHGCGGKLVAVEKMLSLNGNTMYCPLDLDKEFEFYMGKKRKDKPKRLLRIGGCSG